MCNLFLAASVSMRAYTTLKERQHYLRLLGHDTEKFEVNKYQARKEKKEAKDEVENLKKEESEDVESSVFSGE